VLMHDFIVEFARSVYGSSIGSDITVEPLRGGLESAGVSLVRVQEHAFVLKPMPGDAVREYELHLALQTMDCGAAAPRILGARRDDAGLLYVLLEWIPAIDPWPWDRAEYAGLVLEQLAGVHACDANSVSTLLSEWDYDRQLSDSAASTVDLYAHLFTSGFRVTRRPMRRALERVGMSITAMRRQAIAFTGSSLLHGDVHPGNTVVRDGAGAPQAVLLDWGRARLGSPLEDVMSWLHSLAFREPNARRIHDSLLARYRRACGFRDAISPDFREACWLAAACNAMAGALRYHLSVGGDPERDPVERWDASCAAADWLRIVRRADAVWRS
jgi:aminoglycoside phosphotransferase (APT) family kinase protein